MKRIIYFSTIDWAFTKQRPHHFAKSLSSKYEIHFISTKSWKYKSNVKNELSNHSETNLFIHSLRLIPGQNRFNFIYLINTLIIKFYLRVKVNIDDNDIIWMSHPFQLRFFNNINNKIVFDCMDYYESFIKNKNDLKKYKNFEIRLIQRSFLIFVSSNSLKKYLMNSFFANSILVNNGVDFDHFNISNLHHIKKGRKIVGYFGGIGSWVDLELINCLSKVFTEVDFHIIGPETHKEVFKNIQFSKNIHFVGEIDYRLLPMHLSNFDVCLYLFKKCTLVEYVNPVKIYEYLSQGKPVVSIDNYETSFFGDLIYRGNCLDEHILNLRFALSENDDILKSKRISFASSNTWNHRVNDILDTLK